MRRRKAQRHLKQRIQRRRATAAAERAKNKPAGHAPATAAAHPSSPGGAVKQREKKPA